LTALERVEVPALPRDGVIAAQPFLLSEPGGGVIVEWNDALLPLLGGESEAGLEPVLGGRPLAGRSLTAVAHVCRAGKERSRVRVEVERWIDSVETGSSRRLLPITVELEGSGVESCQRVASTVPIESLGPGEYEYGFRFRSEEDGTAVEHRATFVISDADRPAIADE
jgi:hypothetical protein